MTGTSRGIVVVADVLVAVGRAGAAVSATGADGLVSAASGAGRDAVPAGN